MTIMIVLCKCSTLTQLCILCGAELVPAYYSGVRRCFGMGEGRGGWHEMVEICCEINPIYIVLGHAPPGLIFEIWMVYKLDSGAFWVITYYYLNLRYAKMTNICVAEVKFKSFLRCGTDQSWRWLAVSLAGSLRKTILKTLTFITIAT